MERTAATARGRQARGGSGRNRHALQRTLAFLFAVILVLGLVTAPVRVNAALAGACSCVILRVDDIQDYWINSVQTAVMDQFINRNVNATLGVVMNFVGNDPLVVNKVRAGVSSNLFELDLHGWNHVDYTTLSLQDQKNTLQMANQKIQDLWGRKSNIFIPPYNAYNLDTLNATSQLGMKIISSEFDLELPSIYDPDHPNSPNNKVYKSTTGSDLKDQFGVYHLPQAVGYYDYNFDPPQKAPLSTIESQIDSTIASYGYAVVTLHPQDFAVKDPSSMPTNSVDPNELSDLNTLITAIQTKGYRITTFSTVAKIPLPPIIDNVPPVIVPPADIALVTPDNPATVSSLGTATATDNIDPHPVIANNGTASNLYPRGTTAIKWTATDANGNVGWATQYVTVSTANDSTKPTVSTATPSANAAISGPAAGVNILVTGTASDNQSGVKIVELRTSTAAYQTVTKTNGNSWANWYYILNIKAQGGTTVVSRATDFFGNQQWASTPITVSLSGPDTTPPTISTPPPTTVEATGQLTPVSLGKPFVFDNSDPSPKVTNNAPGASEADLGLPLGTTTVTWTATDISGNSASSNQIINVVDTTPPPTPQPLSPANGATITGNNSTISFVWSNVTDTVSSSSVTYELLVSGTPDFASPPVISQSGLTESSYAVPSSSPLASGLYYWKVRSSDASDNESPYSSIQSFTVNTANATVAATPPGGLYNATQSVALVASQAGFTIYYTTDGTAPTANSTVYAGEPITVSSDTTLKFFGRDDSGGTTPTVTEVYSIDTVAPAVTASPRGGLYNAAQSVTLTASESATIYYTTDGSTPALSSPIYSSPIQIISSNTDLKFFARDTAGNDGQVVVETYVIDTVPPAVTASPPGGTYNATQSVTLTASKPGSTIYYTTDGSTPTTSSSVYTGPISTSGQGTTTILKFFAVDGIGNVGAITTQEYVISTTTSFPITQMNDTTASSGLAMYSAQQAHAEFVSPASQLIGKSIDQITLKLRKTGSPAGVAEVGVFNADLTLKKSFGTKDVSTLTSTYTDYTFSLSGLDLYTVQSGDRIGVKYAGGSPTSFVAVMLDHDSSDPFDGVSTYRQQFGTSSWTSVTQDDMYMVLKQTHDSTDTIPPTITASPVGGTYTAAVSVTLLANEPATTIYYTLDGSTPTTSSSVYNVPIQISTTTALKFFGKDAAGNASPVSTETYTINTASFPITQMNDTTASSGLAMYSAQQAHVEFLSPTSQLIGKSIDQITLKLRKTASPAGTMQIGIFNPDLTVKKLFGTKDAFTLTSTYTDYTFSLSSNETYTLQSGDRIGIQYPSGDAADFVAVMLDRNAADPFDGASTYRQQFSTSWTSVTADDMYMVLKQTHG